MTANKRDSVDIEETVRERIQADSHLLPYKECIRRRVQQVIETERRLTGGQIDLSDFASGHEYFGMHFQDGHWVFREWAPNATAIYLKGSFSDWKSEKRYSLSKITQTGVWEIELHRDALQHKDEYRLEMHWSGGSGDRIPAWTRRVVQDLATSGFNAQIGRPHRPYEWENTAPLSINEPFLIYETHVGMATEDEKTGKNDEFRENILSRIHDAGYGAIQIMAVAEHPYYASFGYQVSSFFACSSRYGTPEELKRLVDEAHGMGVPDYWIKLLKETPDDFWPMGRLWHELTNRRHDEKTISYAESHDQALVGDQTLIFRLIEDRMYTHMSMFAEDLVVSRGIAFANEVT